MYCTRDNIEITRIAADRLLELCDDERIGADNDAIIARINAAIAGASTKINSLLCGAYSVPLQLPPPQLITSLAVDIAAFLLWSRREGDVPKPIMQCYTDAVRMLEMLRKEKLQNNDMLYPAADAVDSTVLVDAPVAQFSRTKLDGML